MLETKLVTFDQLDDLNRLFCTNRHTEKCQCMWYIISVKAFHAGGAEQNKARLLQLALTEDVPIGLLGYQDNEPIAWCAVGPRERYARAIKTPSYRPVAKDQLTDVWLVPCFFIRSDARGSGISKQLLEAAIQLARDHHAQAIDGFPFTSDKRRSSSQIHVGFDATFRACGFEPIYKPSQSRIVMRRSLSSQTELLDARA